jgi:hypothetical protein
MNAEETKIVMTLTPAVPTYKLGGIIIEAGDCAEWRSFLQGEQGEVDRLSGLASIDRELDVLFLKSWSSLGGDPIIKTEAQVEAAFAELQPWTGTRWAIQWDDTGYGTLFDCRTGQPADLTDPEAAEACKNIVQAIARQKQLRVQHTRRDNPIEEMP